MPPLRTLLAIHAVLLAGVLFTPAQAGTRNAARPPQGASATAGGSVVQVGFDGNFQPTGWVPMKVRISPPGGESGQYLLRVHQRDLDGDQVIFQRSITLTGGMPDQEFWTYFKPQPVNPFTARDSAFARAELRVVLCDASGRELAQLALGVKLDPLYSGNDFAFGGSGRGKRLVLCVSEAGGVFLGSDEYRERVVGLTEDIIPVGVTPAELPDRAIGYESVDAVVWQDADPAALAAGGSERFDALRQWVRGGGKLIVTARSEWQSLEPVFDLLPVTPTGAIELSDLTPLQSIVLEGLTGGSAINTAGVVSAWKNAPGPFRYVLSDPKPDAIVESMFTFEQVGDSGEANAKEAPFMARRTEGFGSVTFVALDFSNRNLHGQPNQRTAGWCLIWNKVLGLGDQPLLDGRTDVRAELEAREAKDLGYSLLPGSRLAGRSVALVTVAMVFFIAYWVIAGPGIYFYLVAKKRTPMSWFFFGAAAVAATFATLGVVKLILRGPPDLRHISIVRQGPSVPQWVHAEMGLYIPEDGSQRLAIDGGSPGGMPTLTGFSIDPEQHQVAGGTRSNPITYTASLDPPERGRDMQGSATVVDVPYRSTLKKLEAGWVGPVARGISGEPRLLPGGGLCDGRLTNNTGQNLVNVHIAFRHKYRQDFVYIVFKPSWLNGESIEGVNGLIAPTDPNVPRIKQVARNAGGNLAPPSQRESVFGNLHNDWSAYWYSFVRSSLQIPGASVVEDDWTEAVRRTPAMLSFFSLLPPMRKETAGGNDPTRLLRRGARELDVSAALTSGSMVIIAEADEVPLPIPMRVDGDEVQGAGRIIYQFVLPLDRSEIAKAEQQARELDEAERRAASQPSTQPADKPQTADQ